MQQEVMHFNKVNNNLTLIVDDLKMRQSGLIIEKSKLEEIFQDQEVFQKKLKADMWEVVKNIENHKMLKKALVSLYKKYVIP